MLSNDESIALGKAMLEASKEERLNIIEKRLKRLEDALGIVDESTLEKTKIADKDFKQRVSGFLIKDDVE